MRTHDFDESLASSQKVSEEPWWEAVYREYFPSFVSMTCVTGYGWAQIGGIDRIVTTAGGRSFWIDEKFRTRDYDDVALEKWSSLESRKPGWIEKDLACDFVLYAFLPSRRCLLLPFVPLRNAWLRNKEAWEEEYGTIKARNEGYTTVCVPVPTNVLMRAVGQSLRANWK